MKKKFFYSFYYQRGKISVQNLHNKEIFQRDYVYSNLLTIGTCSIFVHVARECPQLMTVPVINVTL